MKAKMGVERVSILETLKERDGMSREEAIDLIMDAKLCLEQYLEEGDSDSAYNVCQEFFGLEPDYLDELI